jgi:hypothetical protein
MKTSALCVKLKFNEFAESRFLGQLEIWSTVKPRAWQKATGQVQAQQEACLSGIICIERIARYGR